MAEIIRIKDHRRPRDENAVVIEAITGKPAKPLTLADHVSFAADALNLIAHNLQIAVAKHKRGEIE